MLTGSREPALDGLRTIAVGLVLIQHTVGTYIPGASMGVDIFFALSGYLITSILVEEWKATGGLSFPHFYLRRFARLMPALALVVACVLVLSLLAPSLGAPLPDIGFAATYLMNWARALGWAHDNLLAHTWSLACEEQFYLLWPPILLLCLRFRPSWAPWLAVGLATASTVCGAGLSLAGAPYERTYYAFDSRALELLIGCAFAFVSVEARSSRWLARLWYLPIVVLAVFLTVPYTSRVLPLGGFVCISLMSIWIILALRVGSPLSRVLSLRPMVYVGRISYGVYLWHFPLILMASKLPHGKRYYYLAAVILTFVLAALSFHF
jgi:peptidoglycan/LPS O-acetylase OafA/YrhL